MIRFIKKNKVLSIACAVAVIYVVFYYACLYNLKSSRARLLDLFVTVAIGFIVNFIFFITQVYIPEMNRTKLMNRNLRSRLLIVARTMKETVAPLTSPTIEEPYTEEKLKPLLEISSKDKIHVADIRRSTASHHEYIELGDWLVTKATQVEKQCDRIFGYYVQYLPEEIVDDLERILGTGMQTYIKNILATPNGVSFNQCKENFYWEYQQERYRLLQDIDKYLPEEKGKES